MPVLLRPDGTVQIGWDPHRAVLVRPPEGLSAGELAALLRSFPTTRAEAVRAGVDGLLDGLVASGVLRHRAGAQPRALSIRVHGRGPLSDLLSEGLRCSGARLTDSGADLVVLADSLAAEPRLVRELQTTGVPHIPVRVRDGVGVVGPLVIPGLSSCLCCADLHRTDRDAAWPALAAQLREVIGCADRPALLATAALALGQLQQIIIGVRDGVPAAPPATLNATLEVDVASQSIRARRWSRHPLCGCWNRQG
ncbi:MAG: cyclodehydratase [Mycobacterium sp.]